MNNTLQKWFIIFHNRSYTLYFIGTTVSLFGTGMQLIANSWLIFKMTNANYSVALLLIFSSLPTIFLSPIFGVFVDLTNRKLLAAAMDVFRAVILLFVPLLWWLHLLMPWHLYLMAFLVAIGDGLYAPSIKALIVELIPNDMLLTANSSTSIANQLGSLVGAGIAGIVITLFSPVVIIIINAGTFLFSALCMLSMPKKCILPMEAVSKARGWNTLLVEMKEGLWYAQQRLDVTFKYMMLLFLLSTVRTINVLLAPFAEKELHVGVKGFGYIDAAFAAGSIVGGLILPEVSRLYGASQTMLAGVWALSISLMFFSISQNLWMAILGYFLIGVTIQVRLLYLTEAQESTDINYQGRLYSLFNTFVAVVSVGIYMVMGLLEQFVSQRWLYSFQGALIAASGILSYIMNSYKKNK